MRSLYSNTTAHVKLGDAISDAFEIMLGVKQHVPDYERYAYHKDGRITEKTNAVSYEILKQQTRTKLQYQYMNNTWKVRLEESSKLEFYREVKTDYEFEKYLSWVKDRRHKSALTKLRISVHKLHIETARYKKYDKVSKTYINTVREVRTCSSCTNKIEDEHHFLFKCSQNLDLREKFFENIKRNDCCFGDLDDKNRTILHFTNKDESIICQLAKFV